ncbi:multicellular organismal development [Nesidiocoris tenuis]|uniref:RNA-directed DNA polymerase n=1 Tax=Nesidiocoris tenuis TaxID=355587 RepID=A0ABN7BGF7_9HEMI|nr:multicellular organismal development [Nesidiocoris tenuis]
MASGFHQIPVHPDSVERTAFVTPDGQWEYLAMPFGLRNAPSVYQRAILNALGDLAHQYVISYMDDLTIVSRTVEEGLARLHTVLQILTDAGFSINISKCQFMMQRIKFLGYHISDGHIQPDSNKVEALTSLPPPQTVTQLRQFIGLASYFRQFVPRFSEVMAPLFKLTSSKGAVTWLPEHEKIRASVIAKLTSEPILMIFDPKYPIELHTDASSDGYGAILLHKIENKPHVVAYFSKRTSPSESRYHSYELETIAVKYAIEHFRQFLQGRKFTVVTDCNSLKASRDKKDLSPRVHRWWAFLQAFDFEIVYRKGSSMKHVDFLSRNLVPSIQPVTTPSPLINEESRAGGNCKRIDLTELPENWLQFEQQRDEEISETLSQMNNGELDEALLQTYEIRSGILFRKIQRNNKTRCLPIVPRALRWSIINNIHEAVMHLGWEKTLEKAYEHYWFEHMSKYVRKFVDNCLTCKIAKPKSGKVQAELHPIPKVCIPWHTIHMDASGKLSGSNETKEYVFVAIDSFTKFVHLHHSFRIDSFNCIQALKASIDLFGAPIRVIADQGRCFASKDFEKFCRTHGIQLHLIATGSSRANGQVERIMSTLKNLLTVVEVKQDQSWQDALGNVQLAMNCTVNRTTKCSPMELMFGKIARPSNMVVATNDDEPIDLAEIRSRALKNIEKNAAYDKKRFDCTKTKVSNFSVNDFVLVENDERNQTKLSPKFRGPFKVVRVLDGDRYLLKPMNSNRTYKYAHDRLKKIPIPEIPLDIASSSDASDTSDLDLAGNNGSTEAHESVLMEDEHCVVYDVDRCEGN